MQLSVTGRVDPAVSYEFVPLWEMTAREKADRDKVLADMDAVYLDRGVLWEEEVRNALAAQPAAAMPGVDPGNLPPPPETGQLDDVDKAGGVL